MAHLISKIFLYRPNYHFSLPQLFLDFIIKYNYFQFIYFCPFLFAHFYSYLYHSFFHYHHQHYRNNELLEQRKDFIQQSHHLYRMKNLFKTKSVWNLNVY